MSGPASSLAVGPGPVVAPIGIVRVGDVLVRTENGIEGAVPSGGPATQIETSDEDVLDIGTIADGQMLVRQGTDVVGVPVGRIMPASVPSGSDWGAITDPILYVTNNGAEFEIKLRGVGEGDAWAPGEVRTLMSSPVTAHGVVLLAEDADVVIQLGTAGANYAIPGSDTPVGPTQLGYVYYVSRGSAGFENYYFVLSGAA